jgi:hypothetical protein
MGEMLVRLRSGIQPGAEEWPWLFHPARLNALIVGSDALTAAVVDAVAPLLRAPVLHWPLDEAPWIRDRGRCPGTLILHDVGMLGGNGQLALLDWLNGAGRDVQLISTSATSVYPLVEAGLFLESLYYRLNCLYVDVS